ncbi:MAG TPA: extracellular solute-binding protein [Thermomicrobiales bacterium]|nr:extracellular solute-binding protein [Thermomicrobiales bacterium]
MTLEGTTTRRTVISGIGATGLGLALSGPLAAAQDATPAATPAGGTPPVVGGSLTVYCGRNEELIGSLIPNIEAVTGVTLDVRFGNTAELAAQILEEGDNTPAGLYFGQDAGALGALAAAGSFAPLPANILDQVSPEFRSTDGLWVGVSGRARVLVYNTAVTDPDTLPASIVDLPTAELSGPIGWAPSNASFQSFVTALRVAEGEDAARAWLQAMIDAGAVTYEGNGALLQATGSQEIAVGLVNHYYLYETLAENPDLTIANYYFPDGDLGSLINVAGVGMIANSGQEEQAQAVISYLLGTEAQTYFSQETTEYPLAAGIEAVDTLPPLANLQQPDIDLSDLADLEGTLALLTELGLI